MGGDDELEVGWSPIGCNVSSLPPKIRQNKNTASVEKTSKGLRPIPRSYWENRHAFLSLCHAKDKAMCLLLTESS